MEQARKVLPHVRAFPYLHTAVNRALAAPDQVIFRDPTSDPRNVVVRHRYTPSERGQLLSFTWWVHINKSSWPREKLKAAVTAISPLMVFSSTFMAEMTGLPASTCTKQMVKAPNSPTSRITGSCDMVVIQHLLESAGSGINEYRQTVRELSVSKEVPSAFLERISGVRRDILTRPERGVDFFPEAPDLIYGVVCSLEQRTDYWIRNRDNRRGYEPQPGNQKAIRESLAGTPLGAIRTTHAPVAEKDRRPYYEAIPGLPSDRDPRPLPERFHDTLQWQMHYQLPARPPT